MNREYKTGIMAGMSGLLLMSAAHGAYLESDSGNADHEQPRDPGRRIVPPTPRPRPGNPVRRLVRRIQVGRPTSYGSHLRIFPLLLDSVRRQGILTLDEAFARAWITINEKDNAEVSLVLVSNNSPHPVFLMAGEIITGGKQNRIIKHDVLLPPRSRFVEIPVYCGERERWTGRRTGFRSGKHIVDQQLRRMAARSESQGAIWKEIDGRMSSVNVDSATRDYQQIYSDRRIRRQLDDCVDRFRSFCRPTTVGAVVVSRNSIVSCDLFSDPDLLAKLWDKICLSYAMISTRPSPPGGEIDDERRSRHVAIDSRDIGRFLDNVLEARFIDQRTPGAGQLMRVDGVVQGNVLVWQDRVVHTALFPGITILRESGN